jgi:hypothetical protein
MASMYTELRLLIVAAGGALGAKLDDKDAIEKKEERLLKKKLPSPKDGCKDVKDSIIAAFAD